MGQKSTVRNPKKRWTKRHYRRKCSAREPQSVNRIREIKHDKSRSGS